MYYAIICVVHVSLLQCSYVVQYSIEDDAMSIIMVLCSWSYHLRENICNLKGNYGLSIALLTMADQDYNSMEDSLKLCKL